MLKLHRAASIQLARKFNTIKLANMNNDNDYTKQVTWTAILLITVFICIAAYYFILKPIITH